MGEEPRKEIYSFDEAYNVTHDECKLTKFEIIDDWLYNYLPGYACVWRFYQNHLKPSAIKRSIKFFFQRLFRGFDDSETWNLDSSFYKWLYPRLKRFQELNCAYPGTKQYPTFEKWDDELKKRINQLHDILYIDDSDYTDWSYIPKKKMNELKQKGANDLYINYIAHSYMTENFERWFAKHNGWLWW